MWRAALTLKDIREYATDLEFFKELGAARSLATIQPDEWLKFVTSIPQVVDDRPGLWRPSRIHSNPNSPSRGNSPSSAVALADTAATGGDTGWQSQSPPPPRRDTQTVHSAGQPEIRGARKLDFEDVGVEPQEVPAVPAQAQLPTPNLGINSPPVTSSTGPSTISTTAVAEPRVEVVPASLLWEVGQTNFTVELSNPWPRPICYHVECNGRGNQSDQSHRQRRLCVAFKGMERGVVQASQTVQIQLLLMSIQPSESQQTSPLSPPRHHRHRSAFIEVSKTPSLVGLLTVTWYAWYAWYGQCAVRS